MIREYQSRAVDAVVSKFASGSRSVCLVSPPGSGKTIMAHGVFDAMRSSGRIRGSSLWIAPRLEIVNDLRTGLQRYGRVGVLVAGHTPDPLATIHVASIQTLIGRLDWAPLRNVGFVVGDEAHHDVAATWRQAIEAFGGVPFLAMTATPERADGLPLSDLCNSMIVAESYSNLVKAGHLVPCRLIQPVSDLGTDMACDPVEAWRLHSEGSSAIVFAPRVRSATAIARDFEAFGVRARVISATTPKVKRIRYVEQFRQRIISVLVNVATLTEGLHLPAARTVILARNYHFVGAYLQATGRALAVDESKDGLDAIVIDLVGSSHRHGSPVMDRAYSLEGRAISSPRAAVSGERDLFEPSIVPTALRIAERGLLPPGQSPRPIELGEKRTRKPRSVGPLRSAVDTSDLDVHAGYGR